MPTQASLDALKILRSASTFQWYVIPIFALIVYVYAVEVEKKNWSLVCAGLAFWGMDWFNEIWNGLVFHFTQYAPVWGAPHNTAFLLLIGLNIEITFMFAIAGITFSKMLPADAHTRILGLPNRWFYAIFGSIFCVIIEVVLNRLGVLTWEYPWWNAQNPWLIFLIGYLPFFLVAFWVFDQPSLRKKLTAVGAILGFDVACLVVFAGILSWI
jgi:hypothetical protein